MVGGTVEGFDETLGNEGERSRRGQQHLRVEGRQRAALDRPGQPRETGHCRRQNSPRVSTETFSRDERLLTEDGFEAEATIIHELLQTGVSIEIHCGYRRRSHGARSRVACRRRSFRSPSQPSDRGSGWLREILILPHRRLAPITLDSNGKF